MGGDKDEPNAIENKDSGTTTVAAPINGIVKVETARSDGLVREVKTCKLISREEIDDVLETEDVDHFGDFSDQVNYKFACNKF